MREKGRCQPSAWAAKPFPSRSFKCLRSCLFLRRTAEMLSLERKGQYWEMVGGSWTVCAAHEGGGLLSTLRSPLHSAGFPTTHSVLCIL